LAALIWTVNSYNCLATSFTNDLLRYKNNVVADAVAKQKSLLVTLMWGTGIAVAASGFLLIYRVGSVISEQREIQELAEGAVGEVGADTSRQQNRLQKRLDKIEAQEKAVVMQEQLKEKREGEAQQTAELQQKVDTRQAGLTETIRSKTNKTNKTKKDAEFNAYNRTQGGGLDVYDRDLWEQTQEAIKKRNKSMMESQELIARAELDNDEYKQRERKLFEMEKQKEQTDLTQAELQAKTSEMNKRHAVTRAQHKQTLVDRAQREDDLKQAKVRGKTKRATASASAIQALARGGNVRKKQKKQADLLTPDHLNQRKPAGEKQHKLFLTRKEHQRLLGITAAREAAEKAAAASAEKRRDTETARLADARLTDRLAAARLADEKRRDKEATGVRPRGRTVSSGSSKD